MTEPMIERASRWGRVMVLLATTVTACASCSGDGVVGPQGPAGTKGDPGGAGTDGTNGKDATNGKDGADGTSGKDGTNGADGAMGASGKDGTQKVLSFTPVIAPTTDADKRKVISTPDALVDDKLVPLAYVTEARTGDVIGGAVFGRIIDKDGYPIKNADASDFVSPSNDFSSILQVGGKLFEVTHFETQPASSSRSPRIRSSAAISSRRARAPSWKGPGCRTRRAPTRTPRTAPTPARTSARSTASPTPTT
jgi:hypothetical protein